MKMQLETYGRRNNFRGYKPPYQPPRQPQQQRPKGKDFFDRAIDFFLNLPFHGWLLIIGFALVLVVWFVGGTLMLAMSLVIGIIGFYFGVMFAQKKGGKSEGCWKNAIKR
jgi:hypothetical protein